ncbi:SDR family oxidoreductase [Litchfieldia salsa]|uniref:NAD(P)H-binding n=1 Tax=Litchfieldia salsa TaxID=930152 RepID=A0A1H0RVL9_9BACI|nr:SDR family oxidoreductase [Litchfieldia salsa]SDP33399.1 NAD(P)H-binding [Litchfieldia salsa]
MKVFVVGANGQIGQHLVHLLNQSSEFEVKAMVRSQKQQKELTSKGIEAVVASLEGTVEEIASAAEGTDVIIFTAGSGASTGDDKTLLVDLDGAVKTIEAAEKNGIDRFVMVSAIQAHNRENWSQVIKPYFVAKHYADRILRTSSLNYTIVRPGGLTNDEGTGKVQVAENLNRGSIPREDVAATLISVLNEKNTYRRSFDLTSGNQSITEAIKSL